MLASRMEGYQFESWLGHTKGIKMVLASALPSAHLEKLVPRHGHQNRGSRGSYGHSSIFDDCMMPLS